MASHPDPTANPGPQSAASRWAVFGLGKTGLSCARFLSARGLPVLALDTRDDPPSLTALRAELPGVTVMCGATLPPTLPGVEHLVLSPGVPLDLPLVQAARAAGIEILGDVELFRRHARASIVAITGSNGKSTVTTLVARMLVAAGRAVRAGANLGTPALDLLAGDEPDAYVLELSSFQLELTSRLGARVACLLNLSPDHLDRHGSFAAYVAAKGRIFEDAQVAVLNADEPAVAAFADRAPKVRWITQGEPAAGHYGTAERGGERWLTGGGNPLLATRELRIRGRHNEFNALAAIAITDELDVPRSSQLAVLRDFPGLPHRCALVVERGGVSWFNDSKGTNVGASSAAIAGIFASTPGVLIAGGQGKGADFRDLRAALAGRVHTAILIGEDARLLAAAIEDIVAVRFASGMREAVGLAAAAAAPGEAVLLSPACASLDMFDNYEDRGRAFEAAVHEVVGA